jgi:hypothetical protein
VKLLAWLTDAFIQTFGITRPRPEQQKTAQLILGGFLLAFLLLVAAVMAFLAYEIRLGRPH